MRVMCLHFHLSIWTYETNRILPEYDLKEFEWKREEGRVFPIMMTLPETSKACMKLVKYGCIRRCSKRRKCKKHDLPCAELCVCGG